MFYLGRIASDGDAESPRQSKVGQLELAIL